MKFYVVEEIDDVTYPHPITVIGYFSTIEKANEAARKYADLQKECNYTGYDAEEIDEHGMITIRGDEYSFDIFVSECVLDSYLPDEWY